VSGKLRAFSLVDELLGQRSRLRNESKPCWRRPPLPATWRPDAAAERQLAFAFISQSGALGRGSSSTRLNARNLPLTSVVSVGNAVNLGVEDYLGWLGEQPEIGTALLYVESIEDHERFRTSPGPWPPEKPVVALLAAKPRSAAGGHGSHRCGRQNDAAIEAFCRSCGIVRVESLRRLLIAQSLGRFPQGLGKRTLILSNSGGPGVFCADRASLEGLDVAALPKKLRRHARQQVPPEASIANPLDLPCDAREDRFGLTSRRHGPCRDGLRFGADDPCRALHGRCHAGSCPAGRTGWREQSCRVLHSMMEPCLSKAEWFATMESAGVPMFNRHRGKWPRPPASWLAIRPSKDSAGSDWLPPASLGPGRLQIQKKVLIQRDLNAPSYCCILSLFDGLVDTR